MVAWKTVRSERTSRVLVVVQLFAGVLAAGLALKSCWLLPQRLAGSVGAPGLVSSMLGVGLLTQLAAAGRVARGRCGGWRHVRIGVLIFGAAWGLNITWLQPMDPLRVEVLFGAASGLFGAVVLWVGNGHAGAVRRAELVALQVVATLGLLEVTLAAVAAFSPSPLWMVESMDVRRRLTALARPVGEPHMGFPTNSLGHYDDEFEARAARRARTVAMIGDSFSASYVPHRYHFTTVAERLLEDTEVYNFGVPGIGPPEYLHLLLQEALPLQPDAVVVSVFCGNDLAIRPPSVAGKVWSWFDRAQLRLFTVPTRLAKLLRADAVSPATPRSVQRAGVLESEAELVDAYPWLFDYTLEPGTFSEEAYLGLVRQRMRFACAAERPPTGVLLDYLDEMRAKAGAVPFGVVLLPAEFQVEERLWQAASSGLAGARVDREEPQASLRAALAARGVRFLDLLDVLRSVPAQVDGDRHCYIKRDTHFNVRGNEVAGRAIAAWLATEIGG